MFGSCLARSAVAAMAKVLAAGVGIVTAPQATTAITQPKARAPLQSILCSRHARHTRAANATLASINEKERPGRPVTLKICSAGGNRHWLLASHTNHQSSTIGAMYLINSMADHNTGKAKRLTGAGSLRRNATPNPISVP